MEVDISQRIPDKQSNHSRNAVIRRVRNVSVIMLGLLLLQYLLGMASNLFVNFPTENPSVKNPLDSVFVNGTYLLLFHIAVGLALGIVSITLIVLSAIARKRSLILISSIGFVSVLLAGESGIEFVLGWYLNNLFSFLMSSGFILAFIAFFALLWYTNQRKV